MAEAGKFDEKEVYVTGAYRKQIEERDKFRKEIEEEDALEGTQFFIVLFNM